MNGLILTTKGRELLAKAIAGKNLHFTRAMTGDGLLGTRDPYAMTALISRKQVLEIQSINTNSVGTCEVVLEMTNKNLSAGYFVREYGLFALDPDTNAEILYAYANKGDKCSYLEAENGVDLINYTLSLVTVIDQAQNITATINSSNAYVTATKLDARITGLYAEGITPLGFWTYAPAGDERLRPVSLDTVRRLILGTNDIPSLVDRVERLEDNLAQVLLSQEMAELYPGATHYIIEDFNNVNQIDLFSCAVTSIIAGDDSIDCEPVSGIIPGSYYTVTDGIKYETVQIQSVNVENGIQRIILTSDIKNTYMLEHCRMYRTSAVIAHNSALGAPAPAVLSWLPEIAWHGLSDQETFYAEPDFSAQNTGSYTVSGNIYLAENGLITLGG